jgi:hypothetical protein
MAISYHIDTTNAIVREDWAGVITIGDIEEYWIKLGTDRTAMACGKSIVDARHGIVGFTKEELTGLTNALLEPVMRDLNWRVAIIVSKAHQYQFAHFHTVLSASFYDSKVVISLEDALSFVLKSNPPASPSFA